MRRCIFGAALLAAIGMVCLWTGAALNRFMEPVCRDLEQACEEALAENWNMASAHALAAEAAWEGKWHGLASAADQTPLEDIDDLFARLGIYRRLEKSDEFAAICAQLSRRLKAVSNAHALNWWNFW